MSEITVIPTLQDLSIGAVFGVDNKESINHLKQLTTKEMLEAAVLIKLKEVNLAKYESPLDLEIDDRHLFSSDDRNKFSTCDYNKLENGNELRSLSKYSSSINNVTKHHHFFSDVLDTDNSGHYNHPMYKVIYDKESTDIIKNYYEKRDEILSLLDTPILPGITETLPSPYRETSLPYRDPLYFKYNLHPKNYISIGRVLRFIKSNTSSVIKKLEKSISILEESRYQLNSKAYIVAKASSLQLKHSLSLLVESLSKREELCDEYIVDFFCSLQEKEMSIIRSLEIIILMRKVDRNFKELKERIVPFMKSINFMTLEDRIKSLKNRISDYLTPGIERDEIYSLASSLSVTSSSLKRKYHGMIIRKKSKIRHLLKKINLANEYKSGENFLDPGFIESMNSLIKKISLSREPKSAARDKELFDPDLVNRANYLLEKINLSKDRMSEENFLEPVFIESVLLAVRSISITVLEMEMTISTLP
ncbi:hypothetical protein [Candidatus Ichthyocystis hellenicum]|uniref:hypothetical protein n=1 Tax=Candidatus Ichthyocystis hellenicum TaxID=1561003 RepID=UPI000B839042|nr:hypothetical protein [Candidatus Ichthyocystis hellenicum]